MHRAPCRHRGDDAISPGAFECRSPKLLGLKLVTDDTCGGCHYRDHAPLPDPAPPARLLPCARRGPAVDGAEYECRHPAHPRTTDAHCRRCPDYLFPVASPLLPPAAVADLLDQPPHPQPHGWWTWPNVLDGLRHGADAFLARLGPFPGGYSGRGVVLVGGGRYFPSAYVTARVLRHVGCRLPVQLWHLAGEITGPMRRAVEPLGVECVDADAVAGRHPFRFLHGHPWKGWQLKPFALAHCPFREVLLLDADSYPVRDPGFLFDWAEYKDRGAVFWPDLAASAYLLPADKWVVFGTEPGWPPLESGQMVVNKEACWRQVQLARWYNERADLVYNIVWGDKDTFNVAWRKVGPQYAAPPHPPGWDTHTILHRDPDGAVLFQHRCQDKFRFGGERFTSNHQPRPTNRFNPRLAHEAFCFRALDELRGELEGDPAPAEPVRELIGPTQTAAAFSGALFAAGLGDVIRTCYESRAYGWLSAVTEPVPVIVASHNPYAVELFRHHRNARNFVLYDLGHKFEEFFAAGLRGVEVSRALCRFAGVDPARLARGRSGGHVPTFDAPDAVPGTGHVVFQPFAGNGYRTLPPSLVREVADLLRRLPWPVYVITRTFPRRGPGGRVVHDVEDARHLRGGNVRVFDDLTVPAALRLIQTCRAYVGSWSSLHQAAWFENKPVAVYHPVNYRDVARRTPYAFGLDRPATLAREFPAADMAELERFLRRWGD